MVKVIVTSPDGRHSLEVEVENVSDETYRAVIVFLQEQLETGAKAFEAIATSYLQAIRLCPRANPSDLWRYLIYRPYLETHSDQSWKRAGGQALEAFFARFYDSLLRDYGIAVKWLSRSDATQALQEIEVLNRVGRSKLDIALLGVCSDGTWRVFGGLHIKGSLAERVSDDVPASLVMQAAGYFSPMVTLDMKAFPPPHGDEVNRGELQFPQREGEESDKRNYFERDGLFSCCYSFNLRTPPTPIDVSAKSPIKTLSFSSQKPDVLMQDTIHFWESKRDEFCKNKPPSKLKIAELLPESVLSED